MTISSTNRKAGPFAGNDATTEFPFAFKVFADTDVLVVLTDSAGVEAEQVLDTDYTLALNADQDANPGGTITMIVAPATGEKLTATSQVPNLQGTDITNAGGFYPQVIEDALDRNLILIQQLQLGLDRSMVMPLSSDLASFELDLGANAAARSLKVLGFDADGNPSLLDSADNNQLRVDLASSVAAKGSDLVEYVTTDETVTEALDARLPEIGSYALLRAYTGDLTSFYVRGVANIFDGGAGVFRVDVADVSSSDNGGTIIVDASGNRWKREFKGYAKARWFGAIGDGSTHPLSGFFASLAAAQAIFPHAVALTDEIDGIAIQAGIDAGYVVDLDLGVFLCTYGPQIKDGTGIIGKNPFFKRRTGYTYSASQHSVLKYVGAGGANTAGVRISETAVGTVGSDFSTPGTDDLLACVARDFHVDANGLAEYGCYVYRAGNQASIGNITAEKAVKANHVHLGCYAAEFGTFGAYEGEDQGVICGWDIFGWGSVEATNFAYSARFLTANNGTSNTYVAGTGTDEDNAGGKFNVGRGSEVRITSESNFGRACVLSQLNIASGTGGTTDYVLEYLEGNADGPLVDYRDGMDSLRLLNGFLHPGNGGSLAAQDIKIVGKNNSGTITADSGPTNMGEWLTLYRLFGDLSGVGVDIDSNTYKYRMLECAPYFTFTTKRPGARTFNLSLEGATTPGSQTYSLRSGFATRYGNIVIVTGRVVLSALDGATLGQIRIGGLPYRIANLSNHFGNALIGGWNALNTAVVQVSGTLAGNTSYIALNKLTAASTSNLTALTQADLTATSLFQFTACYITDDA